MANFSHIRRSNERVSRSISLSGFGRSFFSTSHFSIVGSHVAFWPAAHPNHRCQPTFSICFFPFAIVQRTVIIVVNEFRWSKNLFFPTDFPTFGGQKGTRRSCDRKEMSEFVECRRISYETLHFGMHSLPRPRVHMFFFSASWVVIVVAHSCAAFAAIPSSSIETKQMRPQPQNTRLSSLFLDFALLVAFPR